MHYFLVPMLVLVVFSVVVLRALMVIQNLALDHALILVVMLLDIPFFSSVFL